MLIKQYSVGRYIELMEIWNYLKANEAIAELAFTFKLDQYAEKDMYSNTKKILMAKVLEALVGAVYLDGGYQEAKRLVVRLVNEAINTRIISGIEHTDLDSSGIRFLEWTKIENLEFPTKYAYNQKMRILGHAILVLFITKIVIDLYPNKKVKYLHNQRRFLINSIYAVDLTRLNDLDRGLLLQVFNVLWGGHRESPHNIVGGVDFLIGDVYLDKGYQEAKKLVLRLLEGTDVQL